MQAHFKKWYAHSADMSNSNDFTRAAGRFAPTALYDSGVALLTREEVWRNELLRMLSPLPGETILDVGCGTGSLAILLKEAQPEAHITGLDPDSEALIIAERKADAAGVSISWRQGFAHDAANLGVFDKVVSSLVFHQVSLDGKQSGIAAMFAATRPEAWFASPIMPSKAHGICGKHLIDGRTNTQLNADGFIENELGAITGSSILPAYAINTPTGTISIFCMTKLKSSERSSI
ncbi:class I SAM-dependent methyltransferase [Erythrobacter donghaensis]|uniref:class I SAM-dependent methyltransferase n=1 Tax=Erythrobacter donghaensis TaxID=267135 RepID=UPI000AFBA5BA|nr:class I SAM-dependent methyltransferase [Erythrobacter donghaensis]